MMCSDSLRRGEVRYIECLGRQFVVWRGKDAGKVHAMKAFCPHLGANLAQGRVRGDCIECSFHAWRFTGDGRVAEVPYSEQITDRTVTESFPVREVHGQVFLYYRNRGPEQRGDETPPYDVPRIREVDEGSFVFRGHHDAGRVNMHIIEFAENAADLAHFRPVHGRYCIPWTQVRVPGIDIEHTAEWGLETDRSWAMYFTDHAVLKVFGRRIEKTRGGARIAFAGPGSVVTFRFTLPGRGEIEMFQTHLPIAPLEQQVDFRWFADRKLPRLLVWYVIGNWISQWARDIEIWENKIYLSSPTLCRDDGPIFRMRRWYQQFIPEEPPSSV